MGASFVIENRFNGYGKLGWEFSSYKSGKISQMSVQQQAEKSGKYYK